MSASGAPVRGAAVLPAVREDIELDTADGCMLVGELASPVSGRVAGTLITFHPLPTQGGSMDSHLFRKAANRLPALADIAVLRFNTRGTASGRGCSSGSFGDGIAEQHDAEAAVRWAVDRGLPNRWLVGWSFGTELALKYGAAPPLAPLVSGAVLLSPPLRRSTDADLDRWAESGKPLKVLVPGLDHILPPAAAAPRFARVRQADVVAVDGARHLWVGERYVRRALEEIAGVVLGTGVPEAAGATAGPAGR